MSDGASSGEMVERVELAITRARDTGLPSRETARAAIASMREPTRAMESAGGEVEAYVVSYEQNAPAPAADAVDVANVYRAMIDEALK